MNNKSYENENDNLNGFLAGLMFIAGLLLGGLVGAGTMLLLAPQSGKKTRLQIRRKGRNLRLQTADAVDGGLTQVRTKVRDISTSIQDQVEDLQQLGQDMVEASVTAVQG